MVGPGSYAGGFAIGKSITVSGAGPGLTTIRGGGPVITFGLGERQLERAGVGVACFCLAVEPAQKIRTGGVEVAIVRQGELVEKHKRRLWPFAFGDRFGRRRNLGIYGGLAGLAVAMGPIIGGAVTPRGSTGTGSSRSTCRSELSPSRSRPDCCPKGYGAPERVDLFGAALLTGGVVAVLWALVRAAAGSRAPSPTASAAGRSWRPALFAGRWVCLGRRQRLALMMQRFGAVFAIAVASAVCAASGHLGTPASVTDGFRPALAACAGFALLAALSAMAITPPRTQRSPDHEPVEATLI
jgi:hypothetical protein